MAGVTNELIYVVLQKMHEDLSSTRFDMKDIKSELQAMRGHMLATQQDIANIYGILGRHDQRLDRIERRLQLAEPELA